MAFINCGAFINGERVKTKKALKEALKADPCVVTFDATSAFESNRTIYGDSLPVGDTLVVVGPDPYTSRKWYGNVYLKDGKIIAN